MTPDEIIKATASTPPKVSLLIAEMQRLQDENRNLNNRLEASVASNLAAESTLQRLADELEESIHRVAKWKIAYNDLAAVAIQSSNELIEIAEKMDHGIQ